MAQLLPWPLVASIAAFRLALAVAVFAVLFPWLMFPRLDEPEANPLVARALWMAFFTATVVHLLAGLRIYEAPVFVAACLLVAMRNRVYAISEEGRIKLRIRAVSWFYDRVDGKPLQSKPSNYLQSILATRPGGWAMVTWVVLGAEVAAITIILFAKAFTTPVPPLSDAPVNLAWLKYFENNIVYHNEVYPRGMYAVLSILRKFTWVNAVILLDMVGPLIALTTILAVGYFVRKTTGSWGAVMAALALYGLFPQLLPVELGRRSAPNSEEFGLIFVLPAVWFLWAHLTKGGRGDRASAAAAAGLTAFTHLLPTVFAVSSMAMAGLAALVYGGRQAWRRLPGAVLWVGSAGVIAVIPLLVATAFGESWHGSSLEYLGATMGELPQPNPVHLGALGASVLVMLVMMFIGRRFGPELAGLGAAAAVAVTGLGLYLSPYFGVNSRALFDRGREIGGISLAVAAGLTWALLERLLGRARPAGVLAATLAIGLLWFQVGSAGPTPYYYYTPEMVRLYLEADETYAPGNWTLVTGFRGYSLALGRAVHMYPQDFVQMAEQMPPDLKDWYDAPWQDLSGKTVSLKTPYYVLMVEKVSPVAPGQDPSEAAPTVADGAKLAHWVAEEQGKLPLRLVFSSAAADVWTLEIPIPKRTGDVFNPKPGPSGPIGR